MKINKYILALAFVLGGALVGSAQSAVAKLFTYSELNTADLTASSIACAKSGGQGAVLYDLAEDGSGEAVGLGCLVPVK